MRGAGAIAAGALALVASLAVGFAVELKSDRMIALPTGLYMPFLRVKALNASNADASSARRVAAFRLDEEPVTNAQFLDFVTAHPQWRKSQIKTLFADGRYLKRWPSDFELADAASRNEPVTNVSWFAAEAYCKARGLRLPTTEQWEYALADDGRGRDAVRARSFEWFAEPNGAHPPAVGGPANGFGVRDMVGLVWEWTLDFAAYARTGEFARFRREGQRQLLRRRGGGRRRRHRLSGLHALFDAREPEGRLYRRQPRLSLRRRRAMRLRMLFAAAAAAALVFGVGAARAHDMQHMTMDAPAEPTSASLYNLELTWTSQDGASVPLGALGGKPVVAAMGYTSCKDMCPAIVVQYDVDRKASATGRCEAGHFSPSSRSTPRSTRPSSSRFTPTSTASIGAVGRCFTATTTPCANSRRRSASVTALTGRAASTMPP